MQLSHSVRTEQVMGLDAQMVLMDALRVFDEREHNRRSGGNVPSYEDLFSDVISPEKASEKTVKGSVLTADDLGLADIDHMERKIPQFPKVNEIFNPVEIHRHKIRETRPIFQPKSRKPLSLFWKNLRQV